MTAAAERSMSPSADLVPLLRDRLAWAIAAAVMVLGGALAVLVDDRPGIAARMLFTVVPVAVLAVTLALTIRRGALLAAGALGIAVTPAALAAVAAGAQWGAVAVLVSCGAVALAWWGRDTTTITVVTICAAILGLGAWAASTSDQLTSLTWGQTTKRTGELLWSSVGSLDARLIVPATGWLVWWIAAGLVAGAALVAGAVRIAATIPLAVAMMIVAAWVIIRGRGDVDMSGGTWIVAGAVAFVGASVRLGPDAERRLGVALLVIAAFIWMLTIVHLVRN